MQKHLMTAALLAAILSLGTASAPAAAAENTAAEAAAVLSQTTDDTGALLKGTQAEAFPAAKQAATGKEEIPNPLVPYSSYDEMCSVLSFRPLILPQSAGYELTDAFVIDGTMSDLRYTSRYGLPAQRAQITVRTARKESVKGSDAATDATAVSGIYSVDWQPVQQMGKSLLLAQVRPSEYAACWTQGGYIFTCTGRGLNRWDFLYIVTSNLIDLTEHYYTDMATAQ